MSHGFCGPHPPYSAPLALTGGFDKPSLRAEGVARRAGVPTDLPMRFSARLAQRGPELARAHGALGVSAYWPIGDEAPTLPMMEALHAAGCPVGLPVTGPAGTSLTFRRWRPGVAMVPGRRGIAEPPADAEPVEPDLLFVPLLAFDRRGHRLGYGAGYYDRTLADLRARRDILAVGIAYAAQEMLFIPATAHDQPLDMVITDLDLIVCTDQG